LLIKILYDNQDNQRVKGMKLEAKRIGSVIGVKPDQIAEYERIHAEVWPGVLATLKRANVSKFSIFRFENMLFSYMEYTGKDYEADMALISADPVTQEWWKVTAPMQNPVPQKKENEWWHQIPEVFQLT
jgi:L-rhamnose mutarotase